MIPTRDCKCAMACRRVLFGAPRPGNNPCGGFLKATCILGIEDAVAWYTADSSTQHVSNKPQQWLFRLIDGYTKMASLKIPLTWWASSPTIIAAIHRIGSQIIYASSSVFVDGREASHAAHQFSRYGATKSRRDGGGIHFGLIWSSILEQVEGYLEEVPTESFTEIG